ncbi:MAG: hypothetical protein R3C26_21950 [Calditrichia bacterium]
MSIILPATKRKRWRMNRVLIVDDERNARRGLGMIRNLAVPRL